MVKPDFEISPSVLPRDEFTAREADFIERNRLAIEQRYPSQASDRIFDLVHRYRTGQSYARADHKQQL